MNVSSRLHAIFLTRNVSTFRGLLSVHVKMDSLSAAMAAVKFAHKVLLLMTVTYLNCPVLQYTTIL